ncbi:hypothetical protein ACWDA3_46715 [Nonomuraea rubra]
MYRVIRLTGEELVSSVMGLTAVGGSLGRDPARRPAGRGGVSG